VYLLLRYSNNRDKILEVIGVFDSQQRAEDIKRSAFSEQPWVDIEMRCINRWYAAESYSNYTKDAKRREKRRVAEAEDGNVS
jgi:hypothetical protein